MLEVQVCGLGFMMEVYGKGRGYCRSFRVGGLD